MQRHTIKIKKIYPIYFNRLNSNHGGYTIIWFEQTFPNRANKDQEFVRITNFISAPETLMDGFEYLQCSKKNPCSSSGYNGYLVNTGPTNNFNTSLTMMRITYDKNTIGFPEFPNHPPMTLAIYVDDHQSNSNDENYLWYVNVNTLFHEYVTVKSGKSVNYRIKNRSDYALTVLGYIITPHYA